METESTAGIDASTAKPASPRVRGLKFPKKKRRRKPNRRWFGKAPKKENWAGPRRKAKRDDCEVCGVKTTTQRGDKERNFGHADHIVPERYILQLCPKMNPHEQVNLMWLDPSCHGTKTSADRLLCMGDKMGFLQRLKLHNFPVERIEAAFAFYKL